MRYFFLISICCFTLCKIGRAQSVANVKNGDDDSKKAVIFERKGGRFYNIDPDSSLFYFSEAAKYYKKLNNTFNYAQCTQNIAFVYDEKFDKKREALKYAQEALRAWEKEKNDDKIANMLKYMGYLNGSLHNFTEAKSQICQSMKMYEKTGFIQGVAVTKLNLAKVYENEQKYDSCIINIRSAKTIWIDQKEKGLSRLFNLNNYLLRIYQHVDSLDNMKNILNENELIFNKNYFWKDQNDFFDFCFRYYSSIGEIVKANSYQTKRDSIQNLYQQ